MNSCCHKPCVTWCFVSTPAFLSSIPFAHPWLLCSLLAGIVSIRTPHACGCLKIEFQIKQAAQMIFVGISFGIFRSTCSNSKHLKTLNSEHWFTWVQLGCSSAEESSLMLLVRVSEIWFTISNSSSRKLQDSRAILSVGGTHNHASSYVPKVASWI